MQIRIQVHPKSKQNKVVTTPEGNIEVYVTMPPIKNLANKAVTELLAAHFKVSKSQLVITKGFTSPYKVIEIND